MNKEAILQETYDSAFNDELEKIAEEKSNKGKYTGIGTLVGSGLGLLGTGGTVYGGVKGYKAIKSKFSNNKDMTKKAFLENIYNDTFNNELLLITGK